VLAERYQYDRNAENRFVSHSMAKSIVSLAVGIALAERKIASLDDTIARYVPELAGNPYGETTIRNMLRMASGVPFKEVYDGNDDLAKFTRIRVTQDTIAAFRAFTTREDAQGTRFHYASNQTVALTLLMRAVTGTTMSEYLTPRLWQPIGAEADATWIRTRDGTESGGGNFNAVLRDYGRLGILLANDGAVGGKQIVPKEYLLEATDWHRQPTAFAPRRATPFFGYGYLFWLFPGEKRRFALLGVYGQSIFVDPELKLVMVITAAARNASVGKEPFAAERSALWRGIVARYAGSEDHRHTEHDQRAGKRPPTTYADFEGIFTLGSRSHTRNLERPATNDFASFALSMAMQPSSRSPAATPAFSSNGRAAWTYPMNLQ
jgi:CubicO group peptidase (beta-lactamase class C family)